jgi:hypothetical protein
MIARRLALAGLGLLALGACTPTIKVEVAPDQHLRQAGRRTSGCDWTRTSKP